MNKLKIFIGIGVFIVLFGILIAATTDDKGTAYLINSTNSGVTDTITTAGDSADASYTFLNKDNKWKYLVVEYIQAAAPIKQLVVASDNVYGIKITYDKTDSTLKLWSSRHLEWVQIPFYAQATSSLTETVTGTLSGNDTTTGTTTKADTKNTSVVGATVVDSMYTITGTDTYALINDKYTTISQTSTTTITDPQKLIYELAVTPDSGTKKCIFAVRGTNYLIGY